VIANLEARLVETEDRYWASISAINENFANIPESVVRQYPMLLSGGMWGTIELTYDETEIHNKKIRPFKITSFTPFQVSVINVDEFIQKRREFATEEWIDVLVNSCGLDPARMTRRQRLLFLCRCQASPRWEKSSAWRCPAITAASSISRCRRPRGMTSSESG
jgi:ATP-dependent Lon protease